MKWFATFKRRRLIKRVVKQLGPSLHKRYGKAEHYTPGQVRKTFDLLNLPAAALGISYAMFLSPDDFETVQAELDGEPEYETTRKEVATFYFGGDSGFTVNAVVKKGGQLGGFSDSYSLSGSDGYGFGGGSDGGGGGSD